MLKYLLSPHVPGVGLGAAAYLAIKGTLWGTALRSPLWVGGRETEAPGGLRDSSVCVSPPHRGGIQASLSRKGVLSPRAGAGEKEALCTPQLFAVFIRAAPVHSLGGPEGSARPRAPQGPLLRPPCSEPGTQASYAPRAGGHRQPLPPSVPAGPEALPRGQGRHYPCPPPTFYITVLLKH